MIHCKLDLLYDICSAIDQHYQKQICFLSLIFLSFFDILIKEIQKFPNDSSVSLPIIISALLLIEYTVRVSLEALEETI